MDPMDIHGIYEVHGIHGYLKGLAAYAADPSGKYANIYEIHYFLI